MASIIKVDTIQDQDGNNIINEAANTITIGASGDTITIPSGATLANSGIVTGFQSTGIDDNATSTAITIDSSEKVGIGTITPTGNLHISSSGESTILLQSTAGSRTYAPTIVTNGTAKLYGNQGRVASTGAFSSNHFLTEWDDANGYALSHRFFTGASSEKMRIDSSGNVGIGTSSITGQLHVSGDSSTDNATIYVKGTQTPSAADAGIEIQSGASRKFNSSHRIRTGGGTGNMLIFETEIADSTGILAFNTNNSERMRIDSSGNVGIGTSSPVSQLHIYNFSGSGGFRLTRGNNITGVGVQLGTDSTQNYFNAYGNLVFACSATGTGTGATERMRIDSSGNVLVGTTSLIGDSSRLNISYTYTNSGVGLKSNTTSTHNAIMFTNPNGTVGTITTSGSSTAYNTSSDYRLKENVSYDFDATTRLKQLKPARFNFITDANRTVDGFLAHEVQSVIPEAITGEKDATKTKEKVVVDSNGNVIAENIEQADWETGKIADEDGNTKYPTDSTWEATKVVPVYQGIDQAKLVPLLVKTIQELEARITTLENA